MDLAPGCDGSAGFSVLLAAARAGSADAMGKILEDCRNYLLLIANSELAPGLKTKTGASDVVQDTIFRAQEAFHQFEGSEERDLLAWLRTILSRRIIAIARHWNTQGNDLTREVRFETTNDSGQGVPAFISQHPSPSDRIHKNEEAQAVHEALAQLSDIDQEIVKLYIWDDQSFEEIAKAVGMAKPACMKRWQRAIEKLTNLMNATREA